MQINASQCIYMHTSRIILLSFNGRNQLIKIHPQYIVPPSPPRNLSIVERTETSITVAWDPPIRQAGTCNLMYGVYTSVDGGPRVKVHVVDETTAIIPRKFTQ